ncbi:MAG: hypothetical protein FJ137_14245 [Deltaproteobacteria bacterium]|nr:hypothetical protein [Deltaproteobacteria bacterium]
MTAAFAVVVALIARPPPSVADAADAPDCARVFDAVAAPGGTLACASPASEPPRIAADEPPPPPAATMHAPDALPAELGVVAGVLGIAGGGVVAGALLTTSATPRPDDVMRQTALWWTGGSLLGLAALVGGGALATSVFDASSGKLRWDLFSGED